MANTDETYKPAPGPDHSASPEEKWGESKNPKRDTPLPARNLKKVGSGEG